MKKLIIIFIASVIILTNISGANEDKKKPESYDELVSWYKILEEKYPDYVEIFKANEIYGLGKVDGGYDLYYVRITNESRGMLKPEVLFLGGPHGDETVGTIGLYWAAKWLLEQKDENEWIKWLLDNREIYIEVCHNPYGFDNHIRWDANDWDLNREADYDWRGRNSELWGSVNGQTLYHFINSHAIRVGTDFHGGTRMLLYPWSSTHSEVKAKSPFSNREYTYAPPDFYFFHVASLRLGEFMGDYGGKLDESNVGTIPATIGYEAPGCIAAWAYGANVKRCPAEDEFVNDELFGNYDGCGIFWISPEMSKIKDPPEWKFGDEENGCIAEVIRFVLHQTDIAQPYIRWVTENNSFSCGTATVEWQVYGCLNVDETYIEYSFSPDFSHKSEGERHRDFEGDYRGGTYWDGKIWKEEILLPENATDLYIIAYARVDGVYAKVVAPSVYGYHSYLRIVEERTNESYYEVINTSDGIETIQGRLWWKSPILHIKIGGILKPEEGKIYLMGKEIFSHPFNFAMIIGRMNVEVKGDFDKVEFYMDGEKKGEDTQPPFEWEICSAFGKHEIVARMYGDGEVFEDSIHAIMFVK